MMNFKNVTKAVLFTVVLLGKSSLFGAKTTQTMLIGHSDPVSSVGFSTDSKFILSESLNKRGYKTLLLWSVNQEPIIGDRRCPVCVFDFMVSSEISLDRRFNLSMPSDKTIALWNIKTEKCEHRFLGAENSIVTSSDDRFMVYVRSDVKTVGLWDKEKKKRYVIGIGIPVNSVAISPDGAMIAAGLANGNIMLYTDIFADLSHY
ncbi:MAG: hypothetical protein WC192_03075 [Candidatus Babeliales bacterium]|jgi:WD40 repeat protein